MAILSADPAQRQKQIMYAIAGVIVFALIVMLSRRNASSASVITQSGYSEDYLKTASANSAQVAINAQNTRLGLGQAASAYASQADQDAAAIRVAQLEGATAAEIARLQGEQVYVQTQGGNYQALVNANRDVAVAGIGYRTAVDAALPIAQSQAQATVDVAKVTAQGAVDVAAKNAAGTVEAAKQQASAQKTSSWISGIVSTVLHFL